MTETFLVSLENLDTKRKLRFEKNKEKIKKRGKKR